MSESDEDESEQAEEKKSAASSDGHDESSGSGQSENEDSNVKSGSQPGADSKSENKTLVFNQPVTVTISTKEKGKDDGDKADGKDSDKKSDDNEDKNENDEDKDKKSDGKDKKSEDQDDQSGKRKKPPLYKRPAFIITAAIILVLLLVGGIILWLILRQYVSTDDAYIDTHVVQISPQVSARVQALYIDDNQLVHKGDLVIQLDPIDYQVALQQTQAQVIAARGRVDQGHAQIEAAKTAVPEALAREKSAQAQLDNATKDLHRFQSVDERARSKQQLDNAATAQTNAQAQLEVAHASVDSARADVVTAEASLKAAEGDLKTAEANVHRAEVNLSYCQIYAPCDGRVTERTVEAGNFATAGQTLFMLVDLNVWVTANFKETQLTHMQPGQPVTIKVDAFPHHKFHGHVDSIQAGSGSRFSVLPAENATGNYVKVVQRIPVKIIFEHDANTNNAYMLSPGLSVEPRVKVR
ncbi:MAG TPA: efflux RND transporter periplasmic adaptor subunit [Verrucomicrobiae bacterium]|jgi:membrane fusion protein (multidrug efflux system)|nr:efflux RND transporter periplasmic adaptor subunit [Verrucomicrobiae bacterium]